MKHVILIIFTLYSILAMSSDNLKPSGEEVFKILLSNGNIDLESEPLCEITSTTENKQTLTLADHLSTLLSLSYYEDTSTQLSSSCTQTKYQNNSGIIEDVWDCQVQVSENDKEGEFISTASIVFSITNEQHQFIHGSIRCI